MTSSFPAPCGPASLKHKKPPITLEEARQFSGPLRAGLIEALFLFHLPDGPRGFPAPCGPASLKRLTGAPPAPGARPRFPAPCGPASLKLAVVGRDEADGPAFSGPLRAGLIEALDTKTRSKIRRAFSGPLRAGLIEAGRRWAAQRARSGFSGPLRAGLIEASKVRTESATDASSFPAPCGPASLKPHAAGCMASRRAVFSGPLRAGLIEAENVEHQERVAAGGFPAPCGPASLKPAHPAHRERRRRVFRPLAGRPH